MMMKKLKLSRQTIRTLAVGELRLVDGGVTTDPPPSWQNTQCWNSWCGMCPIRDGGSR